MNYYVNRAEPLPSLMTGPSPPGAMPSWEAFERVVTSPLYLLHLWQLEHGDDE